MRPLFPLLVLIAGCTCRDAVVPSLASLDAQWVAPGDTLEIPISELLVEGDLDGMSWFVDADQGITAAVNGDTLRIVGASDFDGSSGLELTATSACGDSDSVVIEVEVGEGASGDPCTVRLEYEVRGSADSVYVAGSFNDWDSRATPMESDGGGRFSVELDIAPGAWPYKFVEADFGDSGAETWTCDPDNDAFQCDEGYAWNPSCTLGEDSCNSLLIVESCEVPQLELSLLDIDRDGGSVRAEVSVTDPDAALSATLDGAAIDWSGGALEIDDIEPGRHTLRVYAEGASGDAEPLYIPFWNDGRDWDSGLMYYVFVDRFANGDPSLDYDEGTTYWEADYLGGDYQGVVDRLDYLDELGVTVIWLTAPQDNPGGTWGDQCGTNYSGYHGYWPADPFAVEDHFGDDALLRELIDGAHDRGMRVLTDWVANHVHTDHPYWQDHPEWFNSELICEGSVWDTDPETCWFDTMLPDIRYYDTEPLVQMVDDAVWWVKEYELDGYRVDAVKHMPHSVFTNFQARVKSEIEHTEAGGDEDFYTVGETFSGDRGLIGAYVNEQELDAQFDFTLYWSILSAIGRGESSLQDLEATFEGSEEAYDGYLMSTFLGNHDVERWIAHASGEVSSLYGDGACPDGTTIRGPDDSPDWDEPYLRLKLGWTWLLTHEGLPLVYYGDEIGLPGYHDPDNRQFMRWDDELSWREDDVLAHVQALGQARREHPAMSTGERSNWWAEDDVLAWARVNGDDQVLVIVNRSWDDRTLSNGLSFAGLDSDATWTDILSGQSFSSSGDSISVDVPAMDSRVLVRD